jgi:hypothetical protein
MRAMQQALPSSPVYHRVLRVAGIGTWVFLGLPILDTSTRSGESRTGAHWVAWLVLFFVFGRRFGSVRAQINVRRLCDRSRYSLKASQLSE